MHIGKVEIKGYAALAPMAGVADSAFRIICKKYGASYLTGEMASSKAIEYSDKKTSELLKSSEAEHPFAIQLFGSEPKSMAIAAERCLDYRPDIIDINMGCPMPKVTGQGSGCKLMTNPRLAADIVKAVTRAADIPVTVKIRKGWDNHSSNGTEFAKRMEQAGALAITVHGRTRDQLYAPPVDLDIIRDIKNAVKIPVIGNGDIFTAEDAKYMYDYTGCDFVMVGRGALGNPFIFEQINNYIDKGIKPEKVSLEKRLMVMLEHITLACRLKGEKRGVLESRKHIAWYLKGIKSAARLRSLAMQAESLSDIRNIASIAVAENT